MNNLDSESLEEIHEKIMKQKTKIILSVKVAISEEINKQKRLEDYKIVWNQLQNIAITPIEKCLSDVFPNAQFNITRSKSTYPDLKMIVGEKIIAIDIKSNEAQKEPW